MRTPSQSQTGPLGIGSSSTSESLFVRPVSTRVTHGMLLSGKFQTMAGRSSSIRFSANDPGLVSRNLVCAYGLYSVPLQDGHGGRRSEFWSSVTVSPHLVQVYVPFPGFSPVVDIVPPQTPSAASQEIDTTTSEKWRDGRGILSPWPPHACFEPCTTVDPAKCNCRDPSSWQGSSRRGSAD